MLKIDKMADNPTSGRSNMYKSVLPFKKMTVEYQSVDHQAVSC